jgi:hypothetical protein
LLRKKFLFHSPYQNVLFFSSPQVTAVALKTAAVIIAAVAEAAVAAVVRATMGRRLTGLLEAAAPNLTKMPKTVTMTARKKWR